VRDDAAVLNLDGIEVVDADTHLIETADLFTSRAPAALKNRSLGWRTSTASRTVTASPPEP
jgi:hypothetical protein